jgi:hypothetical protein
MKRLILASAVLGLGLAGTIGTANASVLSATALGIWTHDVASDLSTDPLNQALPGARVGLVTVPSGAEAGSGPINFSLSGASPNTVTNFLATGPFAFTSATSCPAATCLGANLSGNLGAFNHATLFEFQFTAPSAGSLVVTHDDGVSLFKDLGGS